MPPSAASNPRTLAEVGAALLRTGHTLKLRARQLPDHTKPGEHRPVYMLDLSKGGEHAYSAIGDLESVVDAALVEMKR